jgi:hypothetical protein
MAGIHGLRGLRRPRLMTAASVPVPTSFPESSLSVGRRPRRAGTPGCALQARDCGRAGAASSRHRRIILTRRAAVALLGVAGLAACDQAAESHATSARTRQAAVAQPAAHDRLPSGSPARRWRRHPGGGSAARLRRRRHQPVRRPGGVYSFGVLSGGIGSPLSGPKAAVGRATPTAAGCRAAVRHGPTSGRTRSTAPSARPRPGRPAPTPTTRRGRPGRRPGRP